jgi:hypothetical protein
MRGYAMFVRDENQLFFSKQSAKFISGLCTAGTKSADL